MSDSAGGDVPLAPLEEPQPAGPGAGPSGPLEPGADGEAAALPSLRAESLARRWSSAGKAGRRLVASGKGRLGLGGMVVLLSSLAGTGYDYEPARAAPDLRELEAAIRRAPDRKATDSLAGARRLAGRVRGQVPRGAFVVIDQTHNRIRLMKGETLLLEAPCSAGSGLVLRESAGSRTWVFDTPRGAFTVLSKIERPVWKKPDWAFVEEGEPIPRDPAQRFEYGVLGEYALYFGNGYMIHGTLYERLIGRPVSHGCIRVGRDPLREIYRAVPLGARVFIY